MQIFDDDVIEILWARVCVLKALEIPIPKSPYYKAILSFIVSIQYEVSAFSPKPGAWFGRSCLMDQGEDWEFDYNIDLSYKI